MGTNQRNWRLALLMRENLRLSRHEIVADGLVHAVGIIIALVAGAALLAGALPHAGFGESIAAIFYVVSLLTVMTVSCVYNLWPARSPAKWVLRRLDHAAIYLLIAGTYTPFLIGLDDPVITPMMLAIVWTCAICGIAIKVLLPGRFDRLAILFYLAIGWSGVLVIGRLLETLPERVLLLVALGGVVYSLGTIFFVWKSLRFRTALWHAFVVAGAALHLAAVTDFLVINRL